MKHKYTKVDFNKDIKILNNLIKDHVKHGGSLNVPDMITTEGKYRNFSVISINGKELQKKVGKYKIRKNTNSNPIDAAHKAAVSLVRKNEKNMLENKKKTKLSIIETTRGSNKKIYGPYEIIIKQLSSKKYNNKKKNFEKKIKSFKVKPTNFKPKNYNVSVKPIIIE